jgi:hypothetical protein
MGRRQADLVRGSVDTTRPEAPQGHSEAPNNPRVVIWRSRVSSAAHRRRATHRRSPTACRLRRHEARYRTLVRCTIRGNRVETPWTPHRPEVDHPTRDRGQRPAERGQPATVRGNAKPPHLATRYPRQPLHLVVLGLTRPRSKRIVLQVARSPETLQTRSRRPNPPALSGPRTSRRPRRWTERGSYRMTGTEPGRGTSTNH